MYEHVIFYIHAYHRNILHQLILQMKSPRTTSTYAHIHPHVHTHHKSSRSSDPSDMTNLNDSQFIRMSSNDNIHRRDIIKSTNSVEVNLKIMHESIFSIMKTIQHDKEPRIVYRDIKQQCLYLQREFIFLAGQRGEMTSLQTAEYDRLVELLHRIDSYVSGKDSDVLNSHMKVLTYITAILTPVGVLVGYFGMNFSDMGAPSNGRGVFSLKHGHLIVFIFIVGVIMFMTYMYYYVIP